ncbi:beta-N-acetylhexosaminidase [Carboxylicivirga sp. N1Y90]|uniref:beta-N-acetylhexosaminidase n=1 Tax=Carboxylicivirga fragile TaxID=3417571 RepID=UPI003D342C1A|nr:family 20 glycosylhydrolase [Marinilabiliaceae bacterium N1Y90]
MQKSLLITLIFQFTFLINGQEIRKHLFPTPEIVNLTEKLFSPTQLTIIYNQEDKRLMPSILEVQNNLLQLGINVDIIANRYAYHANTIELKIDPNKNTQSYTIDINQCNISISAGSSVGLKYGLISLSQVLQYAKENDGIPCLYIADRPDFERRSIMLDISRDKVPTMQTLYMLVDKFTSWKINELQLYTEHTFAYENHETVWKNASPMTAEQIQKLDSYCKANFIDLVPNQNSFGHMKRWLIHEEYEHLAELTKPGKTIWGMRSRNSLSPVEPGSLDLMKDLYAQLIPNFSSQYFNIGCDETVELGVGKSKALCAEIGKGRVYLDFVLELKEEVDKYDKTVQFWGDIILHYPKLIPEIPKDMISLVWGYNPNHPFDKECAKFKEAGLEYYVCPGTSTWNSILGRNEHAFANLRNAAINGNEYDAMGYMITNWGDQGHWQPLSTSYPTFLYGAGLAWQTDANIDINIADNLSKFVLNDNSETAGQALVNLGNAYLQTGVETDNSNVFHQLLIRRKQPLKSDRWLNPVSKRDIDKTIDYINTNMAIIESVPMNCIDADIIKAELAQACALSLHACQLALVKLQTSNTDLANISQEDRNILIKELEEIIKGHEQTWMLRNRIGGLSDSSIKLNRVLNSYK